MAELKISFDIRVTPRLAKYGLAAALVCLCVPELASESVTLSTYYPAPSGVYTTLITTGNTYLARDSGTVDIGLNQGTSASLVVHGSGTFSSSVSVAQNSNVNVGNTAFLSSGGGYMHLANNTYYNGGAWVNNGSAGALLQFSGSNVTFYRHNGSGSFTAEMSIDSTGHTTFNSNVAVNSGSLSVPSGSVSVGGAIDATSSSVFRGYGGANCSGSPAVYGAGVTNCPGGTYATLISGIMTKYQLIADPVNPSGEMLCCTCGALGCPSF